MEKIESEICVNRDPCASHCYHYEPRTHSNSVLDQRGSNAVNTKAGLIMNKISLKFKLKRKSLGLTKSEFSRLLGIAQGYLSDVENGVKIPSDSLLLLFEHINKSK